MERAFRARRSCLAVPASSERFIEKARGLPADEVFLDLEDAVAPGAKAQARANAAVAVGGDWGGRLVAVRVNDAATQWAHRDVLDVASGGRVDAVIFMASVGIRSLDVGGQPEGYVGGDAYHYALMRILIAARSRGLQAIDGPYLKVRDADGLRRSAASSAALGFDGKWALHPDQIEAVNQAFAPAEADYARAAAIIEAYAHATTVQARGAVMLGDEMIDEASRKMAEVIVARGNAAGYGENR